ncbi:unnamed protein product [Orchesella dallaii]|uniref:Uncharacterized protein n=1 Tax=Orchesella dallaii TaxID=48710 RepID=A0ABP1S3U2_9HEXA
MDMDSSCDLHVQGNADRKRSWFKTAVTIVTWIELLLGLSAIASAAFLNRRVPVLLYVFFGIYLGVFVWILYTTCRNTYLQKGPLNYIYGICIGCTIATVGVLLWTFLASPNAGEIAFITLIVFLVSLVLFPFLSATFYCFLRGNFTMPNYMKGKTNQRGVDQPDTSGTQLAYDYPRTDV